MRLRRRSGVSLVETLVVSAILAVVAAMVLTIFATMWKVVSEWK